MLARYRRSGFEYALLLVTTVALAFGCAAATDAGNEAGDGSSEVREEGPALSTTTSHPATASSPTSTSPNVEPPGSTLSYGGETVKGKLGSYCWVAENAGACLDGGFSIDVDAKEALRAPSGAALRFAYEGERLDTLDVSARGLGGRARDLRTSLSGTRARVVANLPAGEYLIEASATMPEGDVTYGFQLIVKG